jgi:hypothetical protein
MWNVEERFSPKAIEGLAALGFTVGSTRGVVRVEKYGCGAEFRKGTDGLYQMTITPTIMLNGQFTRLWDAGYQKFLLTDEGLKFPALAPHLHNLRKFNEELAPRWASPVLQRGARFREPDQRLRSRQGPQGRCAGRNSRRAQRKGGH